MTVENYLVQFCAPTLAGIKVGNLFGLCYENRDELMEQIRSFNEACRDKDIHIRLLKNKNGRALVYIYRESLLRKTIKLSCVQDFLAEAGYDGMTLDRVLARLVYRVQMSDSFPHEIGIFLGYPMCDVLGFMEHKGRDFICTGYWKVYGNAKETQQLFLEYDKCRECVMKEFKQGRSVVQLVATA